MSFSERDHINEEWSSSSCCHSVSTNPLHSFLYSLKAKDRHTILQKQCNPRFQMNIVSPRVLQDCFVWVETITCRDSDETYKTLERNSSRVVVMKVIKKSGKKAAFHSLLKELELLDSPYLVKYTKCYEDENVFKVWDLAVCNGLDRNGKLQVGIIEGLHGFECGIEWRSIAWDCELLPFGSWIPSFSSHYPWSSWTLKW